MVKSTVLSLVSFIKQPPNPSTDKNSTLSSLSLCQVCISVCTCPAQPSFSSPCRPHNPPYVYKTDVQTRCSCTEGKGLQTDPPHVSVSLALCNRRRAKAPLVRCVGVIANSNTRVLSSPLEFRRCLLRSGSRRGLVSLLLDSFPAFKGRGVEETFQAVSCEFSSKHVRWNSRQENTLRLHSTTVEARREKSSMCFLAQTPPGLPRKKTLK